jgi:N-acetylmuramoyl-L-alanine amidase
VRRERDVVVVVDAGHGGHDPGALGPRGLREKDVTLAISRRLVALINSEPGMRGVLTRSDDRFLDLRARMERARSVSADLFISIHADAAMNRSARGSTVYVLSEKAASDEASRRLAARENAALIGGVELGNKDPVLASVLMDLSQNASISSSISVGDAILGEMASAWASASRQGAARPVHGAEVARCAIGADRDGLYLQSRG